MTPVANARMYAVAPDAAEAWRRLLRHAIGVAGLEMIVVDHPPPAGLPELWARPDLGCAFMCGWPFAQEGGVRPIVAAPVPASPWSEGQPIYRSEFIVAIDSAYTTLDEVRHRRFAFNARHSHSGWNLPNAHLGGPPPGKLVGPFVTHQRAMAAVASGEADFACIDSLVLDLLRRHDPAFVAKLRVIAATSSSPIPLLVGAHPAHGDRLGEDARARLRAALLALDADDAGRALLAAVALRGFVRVDAARYAQTLHTEAVAARHAA